MRRKSRYLRLADSTDRDWVNSEGREVGIDLIKKLRNTKRSLYMHMYRS